MISMISQRLALLAMMLVLAIGVVSAQPDTDSDRGGKGRGHGKGFERGEHKGPSLEDCFRKLELTQEQQDAIAALKERAANAAQGHRETIAALEARLHAAREAGDREAAARIMAEIRKQKEALGGMEKRVMEAMLALLTREQNAALKDCMTPRGGGRDNNHSRKDCFSNIGLSDDQKAAINALREAFHAEYADEMHELRELHKLVREARRAGDADALTRLRAAIEEKSAALKAAQTRLHNAVLDVLTAEQRAALEECMENRGDKGKRRGGVPNQVVPQLN